MSHRNWPVFKNTRRELYSWRTFGTMCAHHTHTYTHTHKFSETLDYIHIINNWLKNWYSWNIFLISRRLLIYMVSASTRKIETYNEANIQKIKIVVTQSLSAVGFLSCMYACRVMQANSLIKLTFSITV